jgi:hypothetical protein
MVDPDWEPPDREIRVDIILLIALAEAEAELEQWEGMPAVARVEMEEMEFSPTSPVWPLGTVAVEPAGRGTEPVVLVERAVEETQEVILHVQDQTGCLTPGVAAEETDMPTARHRAKADRVSW